MEILCRIASRMVSAWTKYAGDGNNLHNAGFRKQSSTPECEPSAYSTHSILCARLRFYLGGTASKGHPSSWHFTHSWCAAIHIRNSRWPQPPLWKYTTTSTTGNYFRTCWRCACMGTTGSDHEKCIQGWPSPQVGLVQDITSFILENSRLPLVVPKSKSWHAYAAIWWFVI